MNPINNVFGRAENYTIEGTLVSEIPTARKKAQAYYSSGNSRVVSIPIEWADALGIEVGDNVSKRLFKVKLVNPLLPKLSYIEAVILVVTKEDFPFDAFKKEEKE